MNLLVSIKKFLGKIYRFIKTDVFFAITKVIPFWKPIYYTSGNESPITFSIWFHQKILGYNKSCYWPVHFTSKVTGYKNIYVGIDAAPGISPNCYIQAIGNIHIGNYTQIAPNVGIVSANHFMFDIRQHIKKEVRLGEYCRIGMGSKILPGVTLGDFTTVSAGSIVTKSFPQGYCVIAGNPAEIVADYSKEDSIKEKFIRYENKFEYNGYIANSKFEAYRKKHLNV
ncbi:MAG: acyltransferase [Vicingaceae bacterium]|nr:acyltransferase [Vicingaceae bacterium]